MLRPRPCLVWLVLCASCSAKRPPPVADFVPLPEAGEAGALRIGQSGPPPDDAGNLCGRLKIPIVVERPNLYFVLDASGSMSSDANEPNANNFIPSRYDAAIQAIQNVLVAIGHRVNYGAALFPTLSDGAFSCLPGGEVFPTVPGDPVSVRVSGQPGNVLLRLLGVLRGRAPFGGTPTAATLKALENAVLGLPGRTYVLLLTDGAPNCDATANCSAAECSINIEGGCSTINPALNCCDPRSGGGTNLDCVDSEPTVSVVKDYASNGVKTYVIGLPGTKFTFYQNLLDRMALAGGTAQPTEPFYYPAEGTEDLTNTLQKIGLSVSISCDIDLASPPPDPNLVNVYFDTAVVKRSAENGWIWASSGDAGGAAATDGSADAKADGEAGTGPTRIRIVGDKCDELKRGDVIEVQVVAGCPSVVK